MHVMFLSDIYLAGHLPFALPAQAIVHGGLVDSVGQHIVVSLTLPFTCTDLHYTAV